ncbi:hypothetical protein Kpol_1039p45 [Vanderwaltozyma polyspora DSM 70294]|uniref:R3H domain-containing protein n=1 Tax=Vanderwaltozyma polyspora (strain ATCC 22028 / DSM 70294 / BCRC 21397 / CBS 2163 / NBRC 10782 / NRRL Y-8283 / UCD 57-17) TaxID=436907 RepID=A7THH0_VANPO|nr:uncharacterized protein Kpol_1039p45 [Vanderwaltozyma polyspora DSM 70294]EDO18294.1 hypothetical protein Kpol_1039p45 [Vanderwaltozyma polyspora DSM 70294]
MTENTSVEASSVDETSHLKGTDHLVTASETSNSGSVYTSSSDDCDDDNSESDSDDSEYESSDNEDLMHYERAIKDIAKGDFYTCMICTIELDSTSKMYACSHCYRVFDYDCIREWAVKSSQKSLDKVWKCPNCNHTSNKIPLQNRPTCWCGKTVNPDPNPFYPNSCGQTCNAKSCIHRCSHFCHLGPHPQCHRTTTIHCECGKHTKDVFCYLLDHGKNRNKKFNCGEKCNMTLSCGIHKCSRVCHSGSCGPCPELITKKVNCYCGSTTMDKIRCSNVKIHDSGKKSKDQEGNTWIGVFKCNKIRTVEYACKNHSFFETCTSPPTISGTKICPYSPKLLKTCPCGKTNLDDFENKRQKCTDPISTCENRCDKPLKCGKHKCPFTCHNGPCMDPCTQIELRKCSCNYKEFSVPCQFHEKPRCNMKCESLMSCRRHRCTRRCCSGKPMADKRKKMLFSQADLLDESLVEAEHICLKDCNLKLSCGIHNCTRKCHAGKCPPCLESDSSDLVCPCGKTVVEAPVRCGTKLPECIFPCIKYIEGSYPCGHKPGNHYCHPADIPCPPCTEVVFKPCKCGKEQKAKALCFQETASCGKLCEKKLDGCHHYCQLKCHLPGECQKKCTQICNKRRVNCSHTCDQKCHGDSNCPDIPCKVKCEVYCGCGRRKELLLCGATSTTQSVELTKVLPCDDACLKYQRLEELRNAFGMKSSSEDPESELERLKKIVEKVTSYEELELPFSETVLSVYSKQTNWCNQIEELINKFVNDKNKPSLHFKPMPAPQRNFIHALVEAYEMYSESQDREPKRSVYLKKNKYTRIPNISLEEALPLYQSYKKIEKERKVQSFESKKNVTYLNYQPPERSLTPDVKYNGFLIKGITFGTTTDDLNTLFGVHLKPTLIKDAQYSILPDGKSAIVYPKDYLTISENVERDIESLAGHFDYMTKEAMLGESVEMCNITDILQTESAEPSEETTTV